MDDNIAATSNAEAETSMTDSLAVKRSIAQPRENDQFDIKHPLQHRWVLWYDDSKKRHQSDNWENNLKKIYAFQTVEDFWCADASLINNILPPSKLPLGSNYHLFKEGVRPMWEDPVNAKGGKWILTNPRSRRNRLDECWLRVILALIGQTLDDEGDICGAVVSSRKVQDRIAIWTATASLEERQQAIGRAFRSVLVDFGKAEVLKFQSHEDAAASGSSFKNEVYVSEECDGILHDSTHLSTGNMKLEGFAYACKTVYVEAR
uniref:Eukaryotic initiation factor 4E putative n=1 Tax=Albugo laibachii Nc14 TaxID=890382 RepID=F0VZG0_9STRA|nr:eukaryotic initiation factor 4E putative [Albugo laibachii Nc14]|eukprot:CCA14190.1 eukaryotic initiation factor 4E putative [Albugo laibachii Nc14]